ASFLDNDRILFQQSGNFFSINTKDGTLIQISKEANNQKRISVFSATPSKDGAMLAYTASDTSKRRPLFVPNYLPYYTTAPTVRRGWSKQKVYATRTDGSLDNAIEIELPKQEGEAYISGLDWLADNMTLIVSRVDRTHKRRQMFVVTFDNNKSNASPIWEETDEKWVGRISRIVEANPKIANQFLFASERTSGFNHLYLANLKKSTADGKTTANIRRLTHGNWEIGWAKWMSNGTSYLFSSTKDGAESRYFYVGRGGQSRWFIPLVFDGMKTNPQLSTTPQPDDVLVYQGSHWNRPGELFTFQKCSNCARKSVPRRLTRTASETFLKRKWNAPKFTEFTARDGKKVPTKIYFPSNFDKSKKFPMVIFVHGAGYLQNVINGWNNYYREFMFNQLLTQKGYVVLDIDYRGSAGYGRDWRTDVYDFLGGKDYEDHIDGIDFMVKEYNVDVNRIGVYGGSYGGFMAAMLVMRAPDKISAAAALRPVMDWKNYYAANPFYTSQRLGDPKKNPEGYRRSSPIAYAKTLRKKLLILHGLLDDNVQAQDSIQLVEQLMRMDKTEYFELMLYPAERHSFQRPTSWEDEYERILALFEENLK
ncbi:MAG: S9 family peptidase, partial [Pyrinomonadaceae bacterium]|nr:S9 family peptidase [Pyrinomonadaceae bacterium]